jgi:serine/threonine protein kinase
VTPRVVKARIAFADVVKQPLHRRALLCRSMAHTVLQLHRLGIVHADIKETNIILCPAANGNLTTKLIDFDASFFEDDPPRSEDELGGDQVYLAPEACRFLCGEEVQLTCAMDVFSLGLLFHQYLTGKLPDFDTKEYFYAHEAVLDDQVLGVAPYLDKTLRDMLQKMLACDPAERCTMEDVYKTLGMFVDLDPCKTGTVPASIIQQGNDFFPSAAEANVKVRATRLKGSNLLSNSTNDADYSGVIKGFNRSSDSAPSSGSTVAKNPSDWFSSGGNL